MTGVIGFLLPTQETWVVFLPSAPGPRPQALGRRQLGTEPVDGSLGDYSVSPLCSQIIGVQYVKLFYYLVEKYQYIKEI